jgi:hypothetical protein
VTWSANSEPDLQGYSVYRSLSAGGPFTLLTGSLITNTVYVDANLPPGVTQFWYRVTASDLSGNESAQSATATVNLTSTNAETADWSMAPGYPNPSRGSESVCLPIVVLTTGAGGAYIDVVDAGGRRLRRIDIASAQTCAEGVLWDGKNDAGRFVAPGIYRAWLIAGDRREHVKLVRQP